MIKWKYINQDGTEVIKTEKEILEEYFPFWSGKMIELGRSNQVSNQNCIRDWVIINWAFPIRDDEYYKDRIKELLNNKD